MSLIREIKETWKPDLQGAREHVRLTIKNYSQLDKLVFHKQLDVTLRGLIVAGFTVEEAEAVMIVEIPEEEIYYEWINERATDEIISN